MSRLLVSVRDAAEAEEALAGGAAIIDVKEPSRGPLGRADEDTIADVGYAVSHRCQVSVALGELREYAFLPPKKIIPPRSFLKFGLSHAGSWRDWRKPLAATRRIGECRRSSRVVAVAYADWHKCDAPPPYDVMEFAVEERFAAFLIDTWDKNGATLLDWLDVDDLEEMCRRCREAGVSIALAGSLGPGQIRELLPANPDYFAVRGAACANRDRNGTIDRHRVAALVDLIKGTHP